MILELCNEGSLLDFIRNSEDGYLPEDQAAIYFKCIIEAMEYLHKHDIIHCDCKSANFLVHDGDQSKLADFGMAVSNDDRHVIGGSPSYMSPEHLMAWRHITDDFDHKSDIYSIGVVLYEMLVGYLPYDVIEDDGDSLAGEFDKLSVEEKEDNIYLDLRKLDDFTVEDPIYVPPPFFPDFVSEEAQNLINGLMEPSPKKRLSISEVKEHAWFKRWCS